jgi:hypothetical protein
MGMRAVFDRTFELADADAAYAGSAAAHRGWKPAQNPKMFIRLEDAVLCEHFGKVEHLHRRSGAVIEWRSRHGQLIAIPMLFVEQGEQFVRKLAT